MDNYARQCEREEEAQNIIRNEQIFAETLKDLYPKYCEFMNTKRKLESVGYKIEFLGEELKIWKQL